LGRDGLEGSFAAFGLQGWLLGAANVPYSEGKGVMACSASVKQKIPVYWIYIQYTRSFIIQNNL